MKILIDPAAGGSDSGRQVNRTKEKDINLAFCKALADSLPGSFSVKLTRADDSEIVPAARKTKMKGRDFVFAVNCAKTFNEKQTGACICYFDPLNTELAAAIAGRLDIPYTFNDTQILRDAQRIAPAVLLRLGYMSNAEDLKRLKSKEKLRIFAADVAAALEAVCSLTE